MPDPALQGELDHLNLTSFAPPVRGSPVMGAKYLMEMGQVFAAASKCNIGQRPVGARSKPTVTLDARQNKTCPDQCHGGDAGQVYGPLGDAKCADGIDHQSRSELAEDEGRHQ